VIRILESKCYRIFNGICKKIGRDQESDLMIRGGSDLKLLVNFRGGINYGLVARETDASNSDKFKRD
jgi:hypothetical protein